MKTILVLGAGRSSSSLINYLLNQASGYNWNIIVGDLSYQFAYEKVASHAQGSAIAFDIHDALGAKQSIGLADVVISLLPAQYHIKVAEICLELNKHLLTASYVSKEMKALDEQVKNKDLLFLNECGLDPGIDHMTAMALIDKIRGEGAVITSFESFTGGLIAPETAPDNPWRYKFTWNPRNVVMAGQGTAKFLQEGRYKYIPYQQLFTRTITVDVPGYGSYEGYANRDSLSYIDTYNLYNIKTMLRGTLRYNGYCAAWNVLVQLGCCDDSYLMEGVENMTHIEYINAFLDSGNERTVKQNVKEIFCPKGDESILNSLEWSGFFSDEKVGLSQGTPAQVLEHILNKKWKLLDEDKDMIVMWHRVRFVFQNDTKETQAFLVVKGTDRVNTAMAQTVGLPLAIAAKLLLLDKINTRGVAIPVLKDLYEPILAELKLLGIEISEMENV